MKGIILAGGSGSRLYPLTKTTSKQLLPVYDKPMIYYPLSTLMLFDIKDILIISTPRDLPNIENLLGNGAEFGLNLFYKVQKEPKGISEAFIIGEEFINDSDVALILGDNIFYMGNDVDSFKKEVFKNNNLATIFACHVNDPERFGVIEFDDNHNILSIEEKPKYPKSNFASCGLYFYPKDVVQRAKTLKPSARGELEITDLNNLYLRENKISVVPMKRGNAWIDAGTPKSLIDASNFISMVEKVQGIKIGCIEEIAYKKGFINKEILKQNIDNLKTCDYKSYLKMIYEEN